MTLMEMPVMYAGGGFPWGLLIIGGILYLLWRNGMFGGPGRYGPGGPGQHDGGGYGPGSGYGPTPTPGAPGAPGPGQGGGPGFGGPHALFEEWHRQAHEAERVQQPHAPAGPPATGAPEATGAAGTGNDESGGHSAAS